MLLFLECSVLANIFRPWSDLDISHKCTELCISRGVVVQWKVVSGIYRFEPILVWPILKSKITRYF